MSTKVGRSPKHASLLVTSLTNPCKRKVLLCVPSEDLLAMVTNYTTSGDMEALSHLHLSTVIGLVSAFPAALLHRLGVSTAQAFTASSSEQQHHRMRDPSPSEILFGMAGSVSEVNHSPNPTPRSLSLLSPSQPID